eukprot:IDg6342t1
MKEKRDIDTIYGKLPVVDMMAAACLISNVLYGNKMFSSFELARGYSPSILGREAKKIDPEDVRTLYGFDLSTKTIRVQYDVRNENQINSVQNKYEEDVETEKDSRSFDKEASKSSKMKPKVRATSEKDMSLSDEELSNHPKKLLM